MTIAAVLLAAGQSARFGAPKLAIELCDKPLAFHAAEKLTQLPLEARFAVVGPDTPDLGIFGFVPIMLDPPGAPLSRSLQLGVEHALSRGASEVLIALADMPLVPLEHFKALLSRAGGVGAATYAVGVTMPPALLGPDLLQTISTLVGDQGARSLIRGLPTIELAAELAFDIDRPADVAQARRLLLG